MYCLLWQACYWIQQPAHLVFYSSSQKPCLYKGRTSCLAETQTNLKFHYKLPPKPCLEGYTKPANKVTSYTLLSCYDGNFCRSSPSQLYPFFGYSRNSCKNLCSLLRWEAEPCLHPKGYSAEVSKLLPASPSRPCQLVEISLLIICFNRHIVPRGLN